MLVKPAFGAANIEVKIEQAFRGIYSSLQISLRRDNWFLDH